MAIGRNESKENGFLHNLRAENGCTELGLASSGKFLIREVSLDDFDIW